MKKLKVLQRRVPLKEDKETYDEPKRSINKGYSGKFQCKVF